MENQNTLESSNFPQNFFFSQNCTRGDAQGEKKNFKASAQWFNSFRKRWEFIFQEKTNVKKTSVEAILPYVRKFHEYLLYSAFHEEP